MKANLLWAAAWVVIIGVSFGKLLFRAEPSQPPKANTVVATTPKPAPHTYVVKDMLGARRKQQSQDASDHDQQIAELEAQVNELKSELHNQEQASRTKRAASRMATIRLEDGTRIQATVPGGIESGPVDFRNEDGDRIQGWIY